MSDGDQADRSNKLLDDLLSALITANHILHHLRILDAYGHISIRNPDTQSTFFIPHDVSPALVSARSDLLEFKVEDGASVDSESKIGWSERYGHSEIYKRFPAVNCIVHSHSSDVLPYGVSNVPLKPLIHMAGFLGTEVPVWDIQSAYSSGYVPSFKNSGEYHDLLIRSPQLGASLASAFTKASTMAGSVYSTISSRITGTTQDTPSEPDHPIVLMRGHGMMVAAKSIEEAVYMAYYTQEAAKVETAALATCTAFNGGMLEGKVDAGEGGSGKIRGGKIKMSGSLHYLSEKESKDTWGVNSYSVIKPWAVWKREVECCPVYINEYLKK